MILFPCLSVPSVDNAFVFIRRFPQIFTDFGQFSFRGRCRLLFYLQIHTKTLRFSTSSQADTSGFSCISRNIFSRLHTILCALFSRGSLESLAPALLALTAFDKESILWDCKRQLLVCLRSCISWRLI